MSANTAATLADVLNPNRVRTKFLDYDARRDPKTNRFCIRCQKDLKPGTPSRMVHVINGGSHILHPRDEAIYVSDRGDMGGFEIGPECARIVGLEWSVPS